MKNYDQVQMHQNVLKSFREFTRWSCKLYCPHAVCIRFPTCSWRIKDHSEHRTNLRFNLLGCSGFFKKKDIIGHYDSRHLDHASTTSRRHGWTFMGELNRDEWIRGQTGHVHTAKRWPKRLILKDWPIEGVAWIYATTARMNTHTYTYIHNTYSILLYILIP